jgi:hypothetical protein
MPSNIRHAAKKRLRDLCVNQFTVTVTVVVEGAAFGAVPEIVTTYDPAVVPGLVGVLLPCPLEHPVIAPAPASRSRQTSGASRRRRVGIISRRKATTTPLAPNRRPSAAVLIAVELTVSIEVAAVEPVRVTVGLESEHVSGSLAPAGDEVTAHASATGPEKAPEGVTVISDVLPVEAPGAIVIAPALVTAKAGVTVSPVTVTVELAETVMVFVAASTPVIVTVYVPPVVSAVVLATSAPATAESPERSNVAGTEQVTGLVAPVGTLVTAHVRSTTPVKSLSGVARNIALSFVVLPAVTLMEVEDNEKVALLIVTTTLAVPPT